MPVSERYATYATAGPARFGATYEEHYDDEPEPFYPGERIGTSPRRVRRSRLPWLGIVTVITVCTGAVVFEEGITSPQQVISKSTALLGSIAKIVSRSFESATAFSTAEAPPTPQPAAPPVLPPVENKAVTQVVTVTPAIVNAPAPQPQNQESDPSPSDAAAPPADAPLPKPQATTPNQKRAEAVGLHPGLSRVLLARLSKADYRNAGFAIKTALAKTPDNDVFVWPRKWEPKLAMFQVRFVRGAPENCRRYVVEIAKDGWLTTARPMEKCGIKVSGLARKS